MELTKREIQVLATVVDHYLTQGQPVGSRTVAKRSGLNLSAASIRNAMADLKDKGFLAQPHTSAGAIPSATGLRFYLDGILTLERLDDSQQAMIRATLGRAGLEISDVLREASRLLSSFSLQVSMVLSPVPENVRWKHIGFVLLSRGLAMAILVLEGGIVQKRMVPVPEETTVDELNKYANYLNHLFENMAVHRAQAHVLGELKTARDGISRLALKALDLAREILEDGDQELFVDGASNLMREPEFKDMREMRDLLELLEERGRLLTVLSSTLEGKGMTITLGSELPLMQLSDYGLISSPYRVGDSPAGVVGLIGPRHMDYSKLVPVVDYTARMLTKIFMRRF